MIRKLRRITLPVLAIIFCWQTRVTLFERYALYDYSIWFLYLIDVAVLILIGTNLIEAFKNANHRKNYLPGVLFIVVLITVSLMNYPILVSISAAGYRFLRIVEGFLFAISVPVVFRNYSFSRFMTLVSFGFLPIVVLAISETLLGHSLGLRIFGEWNFSTAMPGIAVLEWGGLKILRPYATFAHPNVFGAVSGILFIYWLLKGEGSNKLRPLFCGVALLGLVLSFSRTAWLATFLVIVIYYRQAIVERFRVTFSLKNLAVLILGGGFLGLFLFRVLQLNGEDWLSYARRVDLNSTAIRMWQDHPFWGIGLNQFLYHLGEYWTTLDVNRYYQPVHNIYLLMLVEIGVVGFGSVVGGIIFLLLKRWKRLPIWLKSAWIFIAITGLFDHYWITIPMAYLILCLILGLTFATIGEGNEKL